MAKPTAPAAKQRPKAHIFFPIISRILHKPWQDATVPDAPPTTVKVEVSQKVPALTELFQLCVTAVLV
jgi:hypothetical protein